MTKEEAVNLKVGDIVYSKYEINRDGKHTCVKVNGKCKTWITRPTHFQLPIKIGFRSFGYITDSNKEYWSLTPFIKEQ